MPSQAAEQQIIAGVVLSERLAVTMYGAIHRAQWAGQRNLRGLVIDPKMLAETSFRVALTNGKAIEIATTLDHKHIVPTVAVESGGPDVVVVTRGVGRYVTVQDLIAAARADRVTGNKLSLPVAAAIGKSVVEALAEAHRAGVVHGAVHPRSVLVDEDGGIRLGDFVVGRALTTAVAQGASSALWRGLAGFLAPELAVGEEPTQMSDVFAVGALLFTMLSGEVPPGTLHVTPAVERLVQRALDTDVVRRYRNASDLLENLLEAFEDDRWDIAERGEVIKAAGLSRADSNIDEATEDLLASLGSSAGKVQVTPMRPSVDIRAEAIAMRHIRTPTTGANKLQALLDDLDDAKDHTTVDDVSYDRDPISELIQMDPRKREAIVQVKPRVPSLDDPDDTPLPPPAHDDDDYAVVRPKTRDDVAALDALAGLDEPSRRVSLAASQAANAAEKLEQVAKRVEAAAARVETTNEPAAPRVSKPIARPIVEQPVFEDLPTPRLKSRLFGFVWLVLLAGGAVGFYYIYKQQQEQKQAHDEKSAKAAREKQELEDRLRQGQPDPGTLRVTSNPPQGGAWLKLGRTPFDARVPKSGTPHEIRVEGVDGYQPVDLQVVPLHWSGDADKRTAKVAVNLKPIGKDKPVKLPAMPPKPPDVPGYVPVGGPIHVDTTPQGAEVWLFIGMTDQVRLEGITAGQAYELRVLKDGFMAGFVAVTAEEWRDGGDPNIPLNAAKKKAEIEKAVELTVDTGKKAP